MNPITDLVQAAAKLLSKPIGGFKSQNKFQQEKCKKVSIIFGENNYKIYIYYVI